jgi:hypothetical protein
VELLCVDYGLLLMPAAPFGAPGYPLDRGAVASVLFKLHRGVGALLALAAARLPSCSIDEVDESFVDAV